MKTKTSFMGLPKSITPEKTRIPTEDDEQPEYITLYRGTTFAKVKEYRDTEDVTKKCNLLTTLRAGQFHIHGTTAAYFSRSRELAEFYATEAAKFSNYDRKEARRLENPMGRGCDFQLDTGGLLILRVPAHYFRGAMVWSEACVQWTQWVHGNRHGKPSDEVSAHFDTASIVEGPCAESHGNTPGAPRPKVWRSRDGNILTQVCIKSRDMLHIFANIKDFSIEEIKV